jgi:D-alanine-D-alanine ligase
MKLRVAVLQGGRSGEHEISLRSARAVLDALDREKYEVSEILISKEGRWSPRTIVPEPGANAGIDVVIPMLHGTFGEDGTVQGLLEMAGLPYVGAGVLASSVSMDKEVTKRLWLQQGIPVAEYVVVSRDDIEDARCDSLPFPVFVKPANLGSSVGISKAHDAAELRESLRLAAQFDTKIIVERGIAGREFECAVLGNEHPEAAMPCEILPFARILRLRGQVPAGPGGDGADRPFSMRTSSPKCAVWRWPGIGRLAAKAWRAWIFCWNRRPGNCS